MVSVVLEVSAATGCCVAPVIEVTEQNAPLLHLLACALEGLTLTIDSSVDLTHVFIQGVAPQGEAHGKNRSLRKLRPDLLYRDVDVRRVGLTEYLWRRQWHIPTPPA